MRDGRDPFRPPATGGGENKKAVMAGRGVIIRAAFFLFLFFSARPCFCLSAGPAAGPSSFSAGGGAVDQIGQLRTHHTAIKRQVISGGEPGVSRRSSSASGRGTSAKTNPTRVPQSATTAMVRTFCWLHGQHSVVS
ncbi:uncharacterized protein LOC116257360 [Nymphaea colorata]|uniref:uncharacterized protein LOC116257360 n=1 Tax=Nymphaea colorata TaxID=210225 RepID=UPI00214E06C0|nr:uncharacterized protein LOC116257360 [Nymphaea colorata]